MVLTELFRLSGDLANRSFCQSDISRVRLKSSWSVGEKLLASHSKTVCKTRLILSKAQIIFFSGLFGNCIIWKKLSLNEFLYDAMLPSGSCSDIKTTLGIDHFIDLAFPESNWSPTEQFVKDCSPLMEEQLHNPG